MDAVHHSHHISKTMGRTIDHRNRRNINRQNNSPTSARPLEGNLPASDMLQLLQPQVCDFMTAFLSGFSLGTVLLVSAFKLCFGHVACHFKFDWRTQMQHVGCYERQWQAKERNQLLDPWIPDEEWPTVQQCG